jgi:amidase
MFKNYKIILVLVSVFCLASCKKEDFPEFQTWVPYDETGLIKSNEDNESQRLRYKLIQSKITDRNKLITTITSQLSGFSKERYDELSIYILDQDIPTLQDYISEGKFSYKELTQWYLYRIAKYESNKDFSLNAMISINPDVVMQAEKLDMGMVSGKHPIYGMPVIFKDNIDTKNMPTTAGAAALLNNQPEEDAEIVKNLKSYGGLVLGKANLSEWANFLCDGCPNGYSAIGGQTLNPYGVRKFDTGGSSSGSAVAVAANYATAAVGSETSGSIISPSS